MLYYLCQVVTEPQDQATFVQYNSGIQKLFNHVVTNKLLKVDKDFAPEVIEQSPQDPAAEGSTPPRRRGPAARPGMRRRSEASARPASGQRSIRQ